MQTDYYIKKLFLASNFMKFIFIKHTKKSPRLLERILNTFFLNWNYDPQETQSSGLSIEQANCSSGVNSCTSSTASVLSATTGSI